MNFLLRAAFFKKGKKKKEFFLEQFFSQILKEHIKYNSEKNFDENRTHIASIAQL
jgi:DNA-binding transcriptional regulator GbsR (MarR family)